MKLSERIYRVLLLLYPRRYREHYSEPMACAFRDQLRGATSAPAKLRLWARTLADLLRSLPIRHFEGLRRVQVGQLAYSEAFRHSVFLARHEASSFARREITVEHLLLGVLRNDSELAATIGHDGVGEIVRAIESAEATPRRLPPQEDLRISETGRRAVFLASANAALDGAAQVETRHLLGGILAQKETLGARLLREHGYVG